MSGSFGRCLVTGGAGFIGSNLVRGLLERGAQVTVLDNFSTGRRENLPRSERLSVLNGDLCTAGDLPALVSSSDYVFHLAAQVGNLKSIEHAESDAATNVLGSVRLLQACRGAGIRKLVYASSSAIFGEAERMPVGEDHPQKPASFYALSKLTAERYALLAAGLWNMPAVCLRFFNVYGAPMEQNEYSGVVPIFLERLQRGLPLLIYGDGQQVRDFVHVRDVVQAVMRAAATAPPGSVFNIGSGSPTTVVELAHAIGRVTGQTPVIEFCDARPGEVRQSLADISRARTELGFEPRYTLDDGLAQLWDTVRSGR